MLLSNRGLNATLLEKTLCWEVEEICLGDLGEEVWPWFVKGMQRNKKRVKVIFVNKEFVIKAKKEDLKAAWEATALEHGRWETVKGVMGGYAEFVDASMDDNSLYRNCAGVCIGLYEIDDQCPLRDERDEDGKTVDCGLRRLEKILQEGQK